MTPPPSERGAALLAVLVLVAVIGAIAATGLEKLRLATALAVNTAAADQARAMASGVEALAALRIDDILAADARKTTLAGNWSGRERTIPLPAGGGTAGVTVRDGGNCFNLNSVAAGAQAGALSPRPAGMAQFAGMMRLLGLPPADAARVAESAGDWVDGDSDQNPDGAEDTAYLSLAEPYRTANSFFADVSELRAVNGVTPDLYARLRPWLCALPTTELSPINLNTLAPEQAPLLAMIAPDQLRLADAQAALARRPPTGWDSLSDFYRLPMLARLVLPDEAMQQPQLRTRWFRVDLRIAAGDGAFYERALVDARIAPARVASRSWGEEEG